MYGRHLRGSNPNLSTMITRPPRPPCWRDFLQQTTVDSQYPSKRGGNSKRNKGVPQSLSFSDLSSAHHRSKSEGNDLSKVGAHTKTSHKKPSKGGKLHRTRSQLSINEEHLPEPEHMMVTLADTKPRELLRKPTFDARIYLDDNIRRCEKWLAGVRASEPLDDVVLSQGTGVKVEVPPEENWTDLENAKNFHNNSSTSESDIDSVSACCGSNLIDSESNNKRRSHRIHDARKPKKMESQGQSSRGNWLRKAKNTSGNNVEMEVVPEQTPVAGEMTTSTTTRDPGNPSTTVTVTRMSGSRSPTPPKTESITQHLNKSGGHKKQEDIKNVMEILSEETTEVLNVSFLHSNVPTTHARADNEDYDDIRLRHCMPGYVGSESDFDWKTCHAAVNVSQS